ncbi:MAG: hypothetical protein QGI73_06120 [Candidatus Thalassarchaeaceae archaeon]|nr:hypothetical protein [Euryarchaeota archaeon]MDP6871785.1 hypothetical protein [Candidatus Thalassarchaeaceae archaeon]
MDDGNPLPTPYGEGSGFVPANDRALSRVIARRDAARRFWIWASTVWPTPSIRMLLSAIATISSASLLVGWRYSSIELSIASFVLLSILYLPTNMASWYSSMVARDRLTLRVFGHASKGSYPGSERILNTLRDRVVRERIRLFSAMLAAFSLNAIWSFNPGEVLTPSLLAAAVFCGAVCVLNSLILEGSVPMRSNDFTLLSLHAPTLHDSTLDSVLTDLLKAHLDPQTAGEWDEWLDSLEVRVRTSQTPISAVEHVLQAIHLEHRGIIDREGLQSEVRSVFKVAATDSLFDSESKFNISSLRALLAHTRAWAPGMFRLIDRLQESLAAERTTTAEPWRLDLDLPPRCSEGQGDLFVMLHNHTTRDSTVELDILVAQGEPAYQSLRIKAPSSRKQSEGAPEGVSSLGRLLDNSVVLWIGLAWPDSQYGPHPVQVTLKGESGETLSSIIVQTTLSSGVNPESAAARMTDAAEAVRRIAIPIGE